MEISELINAAYLVVLLVIAIVRWIAVIVVVPAGPTRYRFATDV